MKFYKSFSTLVYPLPQLSQFFWYHTASSLSSSLRISSSLPYACTRRDICSSLALLSAFLSGDRRATDSSVFSLTANNGPLIKSWSGILGKAAVFCLCMLKLFGMGLLSSSDSVVCSRFWPSAVYELISTGCSYSDYYSLSVFDRSSEPRFEFSSFSNFSCSSIAKVN